MTSISKHDPKMYAVALRTPPNLAKYFESQLSIISRKTEYYKIYDIQKNPKVCLVLAELIKCNQRMLPNTGNYQMFNLEGKTYRLPYFNNAVTVKSVLGQVNITTLSYGATSLHGFKVSVTKSLISNEPAERFNRIIQFLEGHANKLTNGETLRLEDFSDNSYQILENSNSYGTIKDKNSKKKKEKINGEKKKDNNKKSETPPIVIALSVVSFGLAWVMYKTCIDQ
tara:strand:- start:43 stop:720 length:678 start_codon:yes stop_codon:yes gene_type:complete